MVESKYPRYRVSEWLDTSTDPLSIVYGVQTKLERDSPWLNCSMGQSPMFFSSKEEAKEAISAKKKQSNVK